jgi:putative ABC transport system substrate-binding protein
MTRVARARLPSVHTARPLAEAGGLLSLTVDYADLHRQAAGYVDRILKGAAPGDLPVQEATKFDFLINLKTAKALGLTIPPSVLLRADRVIE